MARFTKKALRDQETYRRQFLMSLIEVPFEYRNFYQVITIKKDDPRYAAAMWLYNIQRRKAMENLTRRLVEDGLA